jgi:voltage-gated potassium channel
MDYDIKKILRPVLFLALLMAASTFILYAACLWEGRPAGLLRCLYMVTITMSTIGYEDMIGTQGSPLLTAVNIGLIVVYMLAVAYAVSNFTAYLIEGRLSNYFQRNKNRKRIGAMDQHYIICGVKDIGVYVARELSETRRPFVAVDDSRQAIDELRKEIPKLAALEGDPTSDDMLHQAGISRARALIAALENDKENLYLVMAAKDLNPKIKIAARYNNPATRHKLVNAGASALVSPNMIGGMRIASELVRPQTVSFLDTMLRNKQEAGTRVEEAAVAAGSPMSGKSLLDLHRETGVTAIACRQPGGEELRYNPDPHTRLALGMTVIFIANPERRMAVERRLAGACAAEPEGLRAGRKKRG